MIHIGLFEGIGGFSLAARYMGWKTYVTCEIAEFPQKILKYHFPDAYHHGDIHTLTYEKINEELTKKYGNEWRTNDIVLTGGFPCQPYSLAGKRKGKDDERHLWPQMLRAIQEIQPTWIVGENVFGLINWNGGLVFDEVQADLEAAGYEVQPFVLPACAVNAPHRRDRIWFVAYARHNSTGKARSSSANERGELTIIHSEGQGGERKTILDSGLCDLQGDDTNTNGFRLEQCKDGTEMGGGQKEMGRQGSEFTDATKTNGEVSYASNTDSNGLNQCNGKYEVNSSEGGFDALNDINEVTMHTNGTSEQGKHIGQTREGKFNGPDSGNGFDYWQNFPTVSPICSRDDEFSQRLDGITFSKWRNESIKAAGNAVVPALVYQIFKAIEQYNNLTHNETHL